VAPDGRWGYHEGMQFELDADRRSWVLTTVMGKNRTRRYYSRLEQALSALADQMPRTSAPYRDLETLRRELRGAHETLRKEAREWTKELYKTPAAESLPKLTLKPTSPGKINAGGDDGVRSSSGRRRKQSGSGG